ncbi:HlyD family secretion protein [Roseateles violae]|uniref:HlyD family secretion protein n=1 Tax=Roseateles violae TaxID=3058042 RepID=A0ABT8DSB4_9BURK|nr:HlyD family secretion protein [Pelomonas sp. PFR6]MDN3921067.1 HlyD family secretion protein [Pelomonas sp. PFR6]
MDILILGIYSFFVWLIFIKYKWLPWNTASKVTVVIIPIVALTILILSLNVFAPSSANLRVYKYQIPIVSQVKGRVIEVPVEEGNRLVKKGDVLFKIDPTPYQIDVNVLTAQLATAQGSQREVEESLKGARGKIAESRGAIAQAGSRGREVSAKLELARKRAAQYGELVATGAGNRFDLERAQTDVKELEGQLDAIRSTEVQARAAETQAIAGEQQVLQKLGSKVDGEYSQVAQIRAQLENAKWLLSQTTTTSPCDCYVVNLQLRKGAFVAGIPLNPVMTLIEAEGQVLALFSQNELHQVAPGNEVEFTMNTIPGAVIKGKVDSIIWAQGMGQLPSGQVPFNAFLAQQPSQYAVKVDISERDKALFLAAGAVGQAAIYTDSGTHIHILRKVLIRVASYMNYLVLKLH